MKYIFTILLSTIHIILLAQQQKPLDLSTAPEYVNNAIKSGRTCLMEGKMDCAYIYKAAIEKSNKENPECTGTLYGHMLNYFYQSGQDDSIILYKDAALSIHIKQKEYYNLAATYNIIAAAYISGSNTDSALHFFQKARDYIQLIGNQRLLGENYMNTAGVYTDLIEYDKAKSYYLKAYELVKDNENDVITIHVLYNLAENAYSRNAYEESWNWIKEVKRYINNNKDQNDESQRINDLISRLYMHEKKYDSALFYVDKSIEAAQSMADKEHLAIAYQSKALILQAQSNTNAALSTIQQAIDLNFELKNLKSLANCYLIAADLTYEIKDYKTSVQHYKDYLQLHDSILSKNKIYAVQEIQAKYETEKKEKQIAEQALKIQKQRANLFYALLGGTLLVSILGGMFFYKSKAHKLRLKQLQQEKENAILNSFILGEERERKRISQDLHDGVAAMVAAAKMSLESIPHLSGQKQQEQLMKIKNLLENTHTDIRHIAHNLLPTVLEKEGLVKATEHFASEINATKLLTITVSNKHSNSMNLSPQLQLMLFRVIQELVNNIVKHSQAQHATIVFTNNANGLSIEITDDGIGYEPNIETGNQGLYSIAQRLKSIGGHFQIKRNKTVGTQAKVELHA